VQKSGKDKVEDKVWEDVVTWWEEEDKVREGRKILRKYNYYFPPALYSLWWRAGGEGRGGDPPGPW
jgi:hypothetical protein